MDQASLVEGQVEAGQSLLREADKAGPRISSAFWYLYDDVGQWRLVLASPDLDAFLKKDVALAYRRVAGLLHALPEPQAISIADVKVVATEDPLVRTLNKIVGTLGNAVLRVQMKDTFVNGIHVAEVLLYRASDPSVPIPSASPPART